jgi:hypothetical protein
MRRDLRHARRDTDRNPGVYIGTVTRVTGRAAYCHITELAPHPYEYGPAPYPDIYQAGTATSLDHGDLETHDHDTLARPLEPGDTVVVAFHAADNDRPVILARL